MLVRSNQRVLLFFLAAVLLPCAGLVVVSARSLRQERELAEKRAADERSRASREARQALERRLDAIATEGRRERAARTGIVSWRYADSSLQLLADVRDGRVVLPWERHPMSSVVDADALSAALRAGERAEFTNGDVRAAAASYRAAVDLAARSRRPGEARLALARVSSKLGDQREASVQYTALLQVGFNDTDQQGIPYALYAASALARRDADGSLRTLIEAAASGIDLPPEALYLARQALDTIAATKPDSRIPSLRRLLDERIRRVEQTISLRDDFSRLGLIPSPSTLADDRSSRWSLFGRDPGSLRTAPACIQAHVPAPVENLQLWVCSSLPSELATSRVSLSSRTRSF